MRMVLGLRSWALAAMLAGAPLVLGVTELRAQQLPPTVAAVIDYQRVLRDAKAAKSIRDQIENRRKRYQDQIAKEERRLNDADKALAKQRSVLSADAFAKKRRDFEADVANIQKLVQEKRRELDQVAQAALGDVRNAMLQIVGTMADSHGFNIVFPSSAVLVFSPKIDLTDEVIQRLDEKLPDVTVPDKVAVDPNAPASPAAEGQAPGPAQ